jgi:hypothetical protein
MTAAAPATDTIGLLCHVDVMACRDFGDPLRIPGPLAASALCMLFQHDQGMPQFVGIEVVQHRRVEVRELVGWNLGTYPGTAYRDPLQLDKRDAGGVWLVLPHLFVNDPEVPA